MICYVNIQKKYNSLKGHYPKKDKVLFKHHHDYLFDIIENYLEKRNRDKNILMAYHRYFIKLTS